MRRSLDEEVFGVDPCTRQPLDSTHERATCGLVIPVLPPISSIAFGFSRIQSNARDQRAPLRVLSFQRTLRPRALYPIIVAPMSLPTETAESRSKVAYANLPC